MFFSQKVKNRQCGFLHTDGLLNNSCTAYALRFIKYIIYLIPILFIIRCVV